MEARGTNTGRIESVPEMPAVTRPMVVLAWGPSAERAADAGAGRVEILFLVKLTIQDHGRLGGIIREGAHVPRYNDLAPFANRHDHLNAPQNSGFRVWECLRRAERTSTESVISRHAADGTQKSHFCRKKMPILPCEMLAAHLSRPRKCRSCRFFPFRTKSFDSPKQFLGGRPDHYLVCMMRPLAHPLRW